MKELSKKAVTIFLGFACLIVSLVFLSPSQAMAQEMKAPKVVLYDVPFEVTVTIPDDSAMLESPLFASLGDQKFPVVFEGGVANIDAWVSSGETATITLEDANGRILSEIETTAIPGWLSLLPALVAIGLALLARQVIPALFFGLWVGSALIYGVCASSVFFTAWCCRELRARPTTLQVRRSDVPSFWRA